MDQASTRELVLRALVAAEIADTCCDPMLRRSFFELSEHWLRRAEGAPESGEPKSPEQPHV